MAEGKQLKFTFSVDEASLNKTRGLITQLTSDLAKLNAEAQRFGGISGGMGTGGSGGAGVNVGAGQQSPEERRTLAKAPPASRGILQNFMEHKNLFKGIAEGSKESLKAMSDGVRQAAEQQIKQLKAINDQVEEAAKSYNSLTEAIKKAKAEGKTELAATYEGMRGKVGDKHVSSAANKQQMLAQVNQVVQAAAAAGVLPPGVAAALQASAAGAAGQPPPGGGGGFMDRMASGFGRFTGAVGAGMNVAQGTLGAVGAIANSTAFGANQYMAYQLMDTANKAERNRLLGGAMQSMAAGDLSYALAYGRAKRSGDLAVVSGGAADTALLARGVGSAVGATGAGLGAATGAVTGGVVGGAPAQGAGIGQSVLQDNSLIGISNRDIAMKQEAIELNRRAITPGERMALQQFHGQMGERIQWQRLGIGGGRNFVQTGVDASGATTGYWQDSFQAKAIQLTGQGYSMGEYMSAFGGLQGAVGERRTTETDADRIMRARAAGFGGFENLVSAAIRSGGTSDAAMQAMGGGLQDRNVAIALGQAMLGSGFNPMGTTTGQGALATALAAAGPGADMNTAQRLAMGIQEGSMFTQGRSSAAQRGFNLTSVINAHPELNRIQQDFLANNVTLQQALDIAKGEGAAKEGFEQTFAGVMGKDFRRLAGEIPGRSIEGALTKYGDVSDLPGNIGDAIKKTRAAIEDARKRGNPLDVRANLTPEQEGALAGILQSQGMSPEAALGLAKSMSSLGAPIGKGGAAPGREVGGQEKEVLDSQKAVMERISTTLDKLEFSIGQLAQTSAIMFGAYDDATKDPTETWTSIDANIASIAQVVVGTAYSGRPTPGTKIPRDIPRPGAAPTGTAPVGAPGHPATFVTP